MNTSTLVNGQPAELGCYVDGHWGQYGPDRLAEIAEGFGLQFAEQTEDPRYWRSVADHWTEVGRADMASDAWDMHVEVAESIETWLNNHTAEGHVWHWRDGEFFLSSTCDDPETCEDETCAHWD